MEELKKYSVFPPIPLISGGDIMPKKLNLANQIFGELLVLEPAPNKTNGRTAWYCLCSCGNICIVGTKELRNGDTKSCGCLRDKIITPDLKGQVFGRLTVIERDTDFHPYGGSFWKCKCQCGNIITTSGKRLRSGHTTSCGCLASKGEEKISLLLSKNNINFCRQYSFKNCLTENGFPCKFDFGIIEDNKLLYLIEYDGIQHFEQTGWNLERNKKRDEIKNNYCKENNIPLIRIPYTHFNDIIIDDLILERSNYVL